MTGSNTNGRGWLFYASIAAVALGLVGLVTGVEGTDATRTFGALIASWLFFAGLGVGGLAFAALMELSGADWAKPLTAIGYRFGRFIPVAAGLLLVILVGLSTWAPWYHAVPAQQAFWLGSPFFATRELIGSAALFGFALLFMHPREDGTGPAWSRVVYLILFALVVSMWAFDFILGPDLRWISTLIGPHLFAGAFISAAALAVFIALRQGTMDRKQRHDAGALLTALGVFWVYLFWSQYLTIWYGNLPDEIEFFVRRRTLGWEAETVLMVLLIFAVPLVVLLMGKAKESPSILGFAALSQLAGLWIERHLLVVPSLAPAGASVFDLHGSLVALGLLGAFVLATWASLRPGLVPEAGAEPRPAGHPQHSGAAAHATRSIG